METIEILIFIGFAVLIGAMIVGFIADWNYLQAYEDTKKLMIEDESLGFEKVDRYEFAGKLYQFFQECTSQARNMSLALYLEGNGTFSKQELFDVYREFNWCDTIQSQANSCGTREDLDMPVLALPRVVRINCTDDRLYLS